MKRITLFLSVVVVIYFAANFRWVHAALVVATVEETEACPHALVDQAHTRIAALFDGVQSSPWFVCLEDPHLGLGTGVGSTNFSPGLPSILILGADGANVDVFAHEWAHAELAERVGVISRTYLLPTWFDEGLAMQVDRRVAYGHEALLELEADDGLDAVIAEGVANPDDFFKPGKQGQLHYAWSRREVARMLRKYTLGQILVDTTLVETWQ